MRAPLVIFVLAYIVAALILFTYFIPHTNYEIQYAAMAGMILAVFVGIPFGFGALLIFIGLRLKVQRESVWGYSIVIGLGILIIFGFFSILYFLTGIPS